MRVPEVSTALQSYVTLRASQLGPDPSHQVAAIVMIVN